MDLKKLFTDERAVSPVIGVILMVAITVILAAVIGAFVLGIGGETQSTPSASLSIELNETEVDIEHRSGSSFNWDDTVITGDVERDESSGYGLNGNFGVGDRNTTEDLNAGEGDRIVIIHEPSDGTIASTTL